MATLVQSKGGFARAASILTGLLNASGGPISRAPPTPPQTPEATWFSQAGNFGAAAEADELSKNFWYKRDLVGSGSPQLSAFDQVVGSWNRGDPWVFSLVVLLCVLLAILFVWMFRSTRRRSHRCVDVESVF